MLNFIKFSLLILIFLAATESFSRIGSSSTLIWLVVYVLVTLFILLELDKTLEVLSANWIVILTPLIALMSVFWSVTADWTLIASLQLFFSAMIGIWVGMSFKPNTIYKGLAIATSIGLAASLINYYLEFIPAFQGADYAGAEQYFVGIYTQKNLLGKVFLLFALSIQIIAIRTKKTWLALPILIALILPLMDTKSVSATIGFFIVLTMPIIWWIKNNVENIGLLVVLSLTSVLLLVFVATTGSVSILDNVLTLIGKDATFTGRTVLWSAGAEIIAEYPMLGVGFQAYWQPGQFTETKSFLITVTEGLNGFHNVYIEALVGLGIFGLISYLGIHITAITRAVRWAVSCKTIESVGSVYLITITILLSQFYVIAFRQHEIFFMLLIIVIVMAYQELRSDSEK